MNKGLIKRHASFSTSVRSLNEPNDSEKDSFILMNEFEQELKVSFGP